MAPMGTGFWIAALAGAYLCGSIPFAFLIGRAKGVDLRKVGSGNLGATNCGRVLGRGWGGLCLALDLAKGLGPALGVGVAAGLVTGSTPPPASQAGAWLGVAAAAMAGHIWPIWLGFKGGRGVATGLGAALGIWPFLGLPALGVCLTWLGLLGLTRYVSLASVVAAGCLPLYVVLAGPIMAWSWDGLWPFVLAAAWMGGVVILRHRDNLRRLRAGTERRLGGGPGGGGPEA